MESIEKDYMQYKWFFTSSGKLVVGGKSASQNDALLQRVKSQQHEYIIMHTQAPGSPFSVIIARPEEVTNSDLQETAIFTGCFSKAWKLGKKKAIIHVFRAAQLRKTESMKTGTWGLHGKIQRTTSELKLVLTRQKKILRAVPETTVKNKKEIILHIMPGKIDKSAILPKIAIETKMNFNKEELLSALPAGGIKISN